MQNLTFDARVEEFVDAEIVTLLWSTLTEAGGNLLDDYGVDDVEQGIYEGLLEEAADFMTGNPEIRDLMLVLPRAMIHQAGQDFALTRNGHGAGFWDGDWDRPKLQKDWGEILTTWTKPYGEADLYVGDDGQLYI